MGVDEESCARGSLGGGKSLESSLIPIRSWSLERSAGGPLWWAIRKMLGPERPQPHHG